jgi:hypothetical protein
MKTFETNGTSYVTAKQIEKEYRISHRTCWAILHKNKGYIRTEKLGNVMLYAFEDVIAFFYHLNNN